MRSRNTQSIGPLEDLGKISQTEAISTAAWLSQVGSVSLIIGAVSLISGHAREVGANTDRRIAAPPRRFENLPTIEKRRNAVGMSVLLTRQSDFRLPGQKRKSEQLSLLAGADNCPGTQIPPGTYTAASPYSNSGDTTGANNTVSNYYGNYYYTPVWGPDHVYSFTLTGLGPNPRIEVSTTSSTYDTAIYILNGMLLNRCPAGTDNETYAIAVQDHFQPGGSEVINLNGFPLDVPLHLFIDSSGYAPQTNRFGPYTVKFQDVTISQGAIPPANDAPLDMDGDGRTDFVVARNTGGQFTWYTRGSNDTFLPPVNWGIAGDVFVPANYDGDGKVDYAVWRPGPQGRFYIIRSQTNTILIDDFGQTGDDPTVVHDFNGDGLDDPAVYRPGATLGAPSYWYYRHAQAPAGFERIQFGQYGDVPVPDKFYDWGYPSLVLRRTNGTGGLFVRRYVWGDIETLGLGNATDKVVPGDYDGDGIIDYAVVSVNGDGLYVWDFEPSGTTGYSIDRSVWGVAATDILAPGDYDGDGQTEFAVWRPGNPGTFYIKKPRTGQIRTVSWGETGDVPVASSLVR